MRVAPLSWSGGKDSALALVSMHGVRRSLVARQASAIGVPLGPIMPAPIEVQVGGTVERDGFVFSDLTALDGDLTRGAGPGSAADVSPGLRHGRNETSGLIFAGECGTRTSTDLSLPP